MGERLKLARTLRGFSQQGLARVLEVAGNTAWRWESGERSFHRYSALIAQALGCSEAWLLTGNGPRPKDHRRGAQA